MIWLHGLHVQIGHSMISICDKCLTPKVSRVFEKFLLICIVDYVWVFSTILQKCALPRPCNKALFQLYSCLLPRLVVNYALYVHFYTYGP